jgi:hypothetical protein
VLTSAFLGDLLALLKEELSMSKYEPLGRFLSQQSQDCIPMTFLEIERVLGRSLPPSKAHRAWWSNNPTNNVMTQQWLKAGYETEAVDVASEKLVFRRVEDSPNQNGGTVENDDLSDPIFGCMKGTMTIPPDLDLTAPADPDWGKVYENG